MEFKSFAEIVRKIVNLQEGESKKSLEIVEIG